MSLTFETMPPAGPVLSTESRGTICSFPFHRVRRRDVGGRAQERDAGAALGHAERREDALLDEVVPALPGDGGTISPAAMYSTLS